jgi:hypothetical protein
MKLKLKLPPRPALPTAEPSGLGGEASGASTQAPHPFTIVSTSGQHQYPPQQQQEERKRKADDLGGSMGAAWGSPPVDPAAKRQHVGPFDRPLSAPYTAAPLQPAVAGSSATASQGSHVNVIRKITLKRPGGYSQPLGSQPGAAMLASASMGGGMGGAGSMQFGMAPKGPKLDKAEKERNKLQEKVRVEQQELIATGKSRGSNV